MKERTPKREVEEQREAAPCWNAKEGVTNVINNKESCNI